MQKSACPAIGKRMIWQIQLFMLKEGMAALPEVSSECTETLLFQMQTRYQGCFGSCQSGGLIRKLMYQ